MPGSGKSVVGKKLAALTGASFCDTDEIFSARYGDIGAFFERCGENAFREKESGIMLEVSSSDGVVSLGGGAVNNTDAMKRLKDRFTVVYLDASLKTLWTRLKTDETRPLLKGCGRKALAELMTARSPRYHAAADYTVTVDGKTPAAIAREILALVGRE